MKFIHTADIHLGSQIRANQYDFPSTYLNDEVGEKINSDINNSLNYISNYAKDNGINLILISGDLFDNNHITNNIYNNFLTILRNFPDINYVYIMGNHDAARIFDITNRPSNLLDFDEKHPSHIFGNLCIYGFNWSKQYDSKFYDSIDIETQDKVNVVMMHGDVKNPGEGYIDLKRLKHKNINYLALGHIHKREEGKLDDNGYYVMCGNPVGRDFGELGTRGFYVVDTEKITSPSFIAVPNNYEFEIEDLDFNKIIDKHIEDDSDLIAYISPKLRKDRITRLVLSGKTSFQINLREIKEAFRDIPVVFENKTSMKFNVEALLEEQSLKGEFVRQVKEADDITDDEKDNIIDLVLREFKSQ